MEESSVGSQSQVFCYHFIDYIIKGYVRQDDIQVCLVVQKI